MGEGDGSDSLWERVGQLDGRVSAMEQSQGRIESQLSSINESIRDLRRRMDHGAGFWSAVVVIASLIGSLAGGGVWVMAQAEAGPFDLDVVQEPTDG